MNKFKRTLGKLVLAFLIAISPFIFTGSSTNFMTVNNVVADDTWASCSWHSGGGQYSAISCFTCESVDDIGNTSPDLCRKCFDPSEAE